MKGLLIYIVLFISPFLFTQNDSLPYELLEDKWIFQTTLGYNTAPFVISDEFNLTENTMRYRANMNPVLGFGITHKWISLGFSFKLPGYLRDTQRFGESEYMDVDFRFNLWDWHFSGDIHYYEGFRLLNNSIEQGNEQVLIYNNLNTFSTSLNGYYFLDSTYNTKAAFGMLGKYNNPVFSFYVKNTLNIHRIKNKQNELLPSQINQSGPSLWEANSLGAVDGGFVPGIAYVNNINGWQFGGMVGFGGVIQAKYYTFSNQRRMFFGLAPRVDLSFYAGYNKADWFLMLHTNIDNKSIRFNDYRYRQIYYYVRLTAGIRLDHLTIFKKKNDTSK